MYRSRKVAGSLPPFLFFKALSSIGVSRFAVGGVHAFFGGVLIHRGGGNGNRRKTRRWCPELVPGHFTTNDAQAPFSESLHQT